MCRRSGRDNNRRRALSWAVPEYGQADLVCIQRDSRETNGGAPATPALPAVSTAGTPTSVFFGSFLGGDASPRIIQLKAVFQF
jgi:hypothetical protein